MQTNRTARRIDFSPDEIKYMRDQAALPDQKRLSYAGIARELGIQFRDYNGGHRSRQSVYEFMTADPNAPVIVRLGVDREIVQRFRETGEDIEEWIRAQLNRHANKKPAEEPLITETTSPETSEDTIPKQPPNSKGGRKKKNGNAGHEGSPN